MTVSRCVSALLLLLLTTTAQGEQQCERLKASLSYTQEKAPRDLSGVLPVVVERVNRELEGVVDVEVEWTGSDLHGKVGDHMIQCKVTRLVSAISGHVPEEETVEDSEGRQVLLQCFQLPFTILDTNECILPEGHVLRHKCQDPALCVNTIGSYDCLCPKLGESQQGDLEGDEGFWKQVAEQPRSPWERSYSSPSKSSCPSSASTHDSCPRLAHSIEGKACRAAFTCPKDPCVAGRNTCSSNAQCLRVEENPLATPNHDCVCPKGLMGNGHACGKGDVKPKPMVKYDGITPTEETLKNNYYCGCTKPEVDACDGFDPCKGNHEVCVVTPGNTPMCACKPGYVDNQDGYGCVDESPPVLKLRPDGKETMMLKQGDFYKEHAVDVIDENAEEYLRSLRITYSQPLPPGCLVRMGKFHVNYTIATPWTSYQFVRVTRNVVVEDIDECQLDVQKYSDLCPELIPQCHKSAKCVNTVGSYTCQCPKHTSGDGFKKGFAPATGAPEGYQGGSGCVDTSKPIIELQGPNPKILKVCKCGAGVMGGQTEGEGSLCAQQRSSYGQNLKDLIESTSGAELCSTHRHPNPQPSDCVKASDHTYKGVVDVTSRVTVGAPVEKSPLHWSVPYNVVDEAGNKAATVWRDVVVEEVDIGDLEHKVRREVMAEKDKELKEAVRRAVTEERAKHTQQNNVATRSKTDTCPACPKCKQCMHAGFDVDKECGKYCDEKYAGKCVNAVASQNASDDFWQYFDGSNPIANLVVLGCFIIFLRFIATLWLNPGALVGRTDYNYVAGEAAVAVNVLQTPPAPQQQLGSPSFFSEPARAAYSPASSRQQYGYTSPPPTTPNNGNDAIDIYADIITPSETGDYHGRR